MADDQATEEEPSIEEILDSIRQIISDDDEEGGETEVEKVEEPPSEESSAVVDEKDEASAEPEDVVELTEKLEEPEAEPQPETEMDNNEPEEDLDDELDTNDESSEAEPKLNQEEPPIEVDMTDVENNEDSILTETAQSAAYDGFAELARKTAIEHNGITLEEIVRTELNPMLRDWLDKHLPVIIDRLVKEELERISKRAESDLDEF